MSRAGDTDVAALAAGAVAVSITTLTTEGPYDIASALVALSVGLVVWGYTWEHDRRRNERIAYSAISGVLALPIIGCIVDLLFWRSGNSLFTGIWVAAGWLGVAVATYHVDKRLKKLLPPQTPTLGEP